MARKSSKEKGTTTKLIAIALLIIGVNVKAQNNLVIINRAC